MKTIYTLILILISILGYSQSWESPNWDISSSSFFTDIYDISSSQGKLFVTGRDEGSYFAYSDNDGDTWNVVDLDDNITTNEIPIAVGFFTDQVGIIGIKGSYTKEYLRTNDGGLTWESYSLNLNGCDYIPQPWDITIVNDTTAIISEFQSGDYIITHDAGNSWECINNFTTSWLPKFTALNEHTFYTFDFRGLYKSVDGGAIWTTALDVIDLATYSMLDEDIGFALTSYYANEDKNPRLYVTMNGWNTFDRFILSSLNDRVIEVIAPVNSEEIYFFAYESIYYSNDGGHTVSFFQKPSFDGPTHAEKINNEWYVFGRDLAKYNPEGVITGDTKQNEFENVYIYPNPVTNSIIRLNTNLYSSFEIYSANGNLIENGLIQNSEISLNSTVKGLYILKVKNRNWSKQATIKIIVE